MSGLTIDFSKLSKPKAEIIKEVESFDSSEPKGVITFDEMAAVFKTWDIHIDTPEQLGEIIDLFSTGEEDSFLTFDEMVEVAGCYYKLKDLFEGFDADGSGSLNKTEFISILPEFGFELDDEVNDRLLTMFDEDGSGDFDFDEFATVLFILLTLDHQYQAVKGNITLGDFHSLLRTFGVNMTPREVKFAMEWAEQDEGKVVSDMEFVDIADVVSEIRENKKVFQRKAKKEIAKERDARKESGEKVEGKFRDAKLFSDTKLTTMKIDGVKSAADKIISSLGGKKWEDPDFPANNKSIGKKVDKITQWLRPEEMKGSNGNPQLFCDGIDEGDVKQGALGDCWFISSISVIGQAGNDGIQQLFIGAYPEHGFYQCRFYKDGEWRLVNVDDRIPCSEKGTPVFAKCKDINEIWVPIIEKAFAKLHGNYAAIEAGVISNGLTDLTAEPSDITNIEKTDECWERIVEYVEEGYFLGCSIIDGGGEHSNQFGLLLNHAYGLLSAEEVQGNKLVKLRNPWGGFEWNGRWSDGSREWTDSIMKQLDVTFEDDGTFYMCWDDFTNFYMRLYTLRVFSDDIGDVWNYEYHGGNWTEENGGGCMNFPSFNKNDQFLFVAEEDTPIYIHVSIPDLRCASKSKDFKYAAMGVTLFEKASDNDMRQAILSDPIERSKYPQNRDNCLTAKVQGGKKYLIVPHAFEPETRGPYFMKVYCPKKFTFTMLEGLDEPETIEGKLTAENSGGCPNHATWKNNPQYLIRTLNDEQVTISLGQEGNEYLGFFVWETTSKKKQLSIKQGLITQSKISNSPLSTVSFDAKADGHYIIMPCTFDPNKPADFTFHFYGNVEIEELEEQKTIDFQGEWKEGQDGGCRNNKDTWKNNPTFPISFDVEEVITISVSTEDKTGMGVYLFEDTEEGKPMKKIGASKFANTSDAKVEISVVPGNYIIMPATFQAGVHKPFTVKVYL